MKPHGRRPLLDAEAAGARDDQRQLVRWVRAAMRARCVRLVVVAGQRKSKTELGIDAPLLVGHGGP